MIDYDRPFLTYDEQVTRLLQKNVVITDENFVRKALRNHSYYTLYNGYKSLFPNYYDEEKGTEVFTKPVDFNLLYSLYIIDTNLSSILFKYILHVERSLKTKVAHVVGKYYGIHENDYLDFKKYKSRGRLDRKTEINNLKTQLSKRNKSAPVDHYRKKHNHIPPWIAVNCFYFGSVINWYKILKNTHKETIALEFLGYFEDLTMHDILTLFPDCLSLLQIYRNNMAHGNRTFESTISSELPKNELLTAVNENVLSERDFKNNIGKKDLFAVMITLFLLIEDHYILNNLLQDLRNLFSAFQDYQIILSASGDIFSTLDIPHDYFDRLSNLFYDKFNFYII
ncbi:MULTISPECIES: Abi family protein [Aerococcus]|uniref:Abi family protein n=1 Tax=Aerococcus TaxID=1375 RepID=UPI0015EBD019|nr:Abi family protein [Aerococcus urinae]